MIQFLQAAIFDENKRNFFRSQAHGCAAPATRTSLFLFEKKAGGKPPLK